MDCKKYYLYNINIYIRINNLSKKNTIIYWIATLWLALGMVSTGIVQIIKMEEEVANFTKLGYPTYLMTIIGIAKM